MSKSASSVLCDLDAALKKRPLRYDEIIDAFRELEIPEDVSSAQLEAVYASCFQILGIGAADFPQQMRDDMDSWQVGHLSACAIDQIELTLFDTNASSRAWLAESIEGFRQRGQEVPEEMLEDDLPPQLNIPWDVETAKKNIQPYLAYFENGLNNISVAHLHLAWKVLNDRYREGYPVFKQVFSRWLEDLGARGVGMPGSVEAVAKARDLDIKLRNEEEMSWEACKNELLPLLDHAHPMVAGGAARYLGGLYANETFAREDEALDYVAILELLRNLKGFREVVCGAFVCGMDDDCMEGLSVLINHDAAKDANFDLDQWVKDVLGDDTLAPDLPNTQPLWFYIHEHYCYAPDMPMRFIDMGRSWVALMCATELSEPVDGMKSVLERLVQDDDEDISGPAKQHLAAYY